MGWKSVIHSEILGRKDVLESRRRKCKLIGHLYKSVATSNDYFYADHKELAEYSSNLIRAAFEGKRSEISKIGAIPEVDLNQRSVWKTNTSSATPIEAALYAGNAAANEILLADPRLDVNEPLALLIHWDDVNRKVRSYWGEDERQVLPAFPPALDEYVRKKTKTAKNIPAIYSSYTPLHFVVHKGSYGLTKVLLKRQDLNVNVRTTFKGHTALHIALNSRRSNSDAIAFLLLSDERTDLEATNADNLKPADLARKAKREGMAKLIEYLIKLKTSNNIRREDCYQHIQIYEAITNGSIDEVLSIIANGETDLQGANEMGKTPAQLAREVGRRDLAGLIKYIVALHIAKKEVADGAILHDDNYNEPSDLPKERENSGLARFIEFMTYKMRK